MDESLYWVLDEGVLLYHLSLAQLFVLRHLSVVFSEVHEGVTSSVVCLFDSVIL